MISVFIIFISFIGMSSQQKASDSVKPSERAKEKKTSVTGFDLPSPEDEAQIAYLGLREEGKFELEEISTEVLLISVFSMYCPSCQKDAPRMNQLFEAIEDDPQIKGKIKIIGIGLKNSDYEVNLFRETFDVPFPLFPDKNYSISKKLGAEQTPILIGVRFFQDAEPVVFLYSSSIVGSVPDYLAAIRDAAKIS